MNAVCPYSMKKYQIPVRVMSFEAKYKRLDPGYDRPEVETYAIRLRRGAEGGPGDASAEGDGGLGGGSEGRTGGIGGNYIQAAIRAAAGNRELMARIRERGETWLGVVKELESHLPADMEVKEKNRLAMDLVRPLLNEVFGERGRRAERRPRQDGSGTTTWVSANGEEDGKQAG